MAELQKEKEISENCFVKEQDDFDKNKKTKNKKKGWQFCLKIFIKYFNFIKEINLFQIKKKQIKQKIIKYYQTQCRTQKEQVIKETILIINFIKINYIFLNKS